MLQCFMFHPFPPAVCCSYSISSICSTCCLLGEVNHLFQITDSVWTCAMPRRPVVIRVDQSHVEVDAFSSCNQSLIEFRLSRSWLRLECNQAQNIRQHLNYLNYIHKMTAHDTRHKHSVKLEQSIHVPFILIFRAFCDTVQANSVTSIPTSNWTRFARRMLNLGSKFLSPSWQAPLSRGDWSQQSQHVQKVVSCWLSNGQNHLWHSNEVPWWKHTSRKRSV